MYQYNFTQQIDDTTLLTSILLTSGISSSLSSINTVGDGPTMLVSIMFTSALSPDDLSTLNSTMSNYTNISAATIAAMVSSISTSIQNQANLMTLLTAKVNIALPGFNYQQLQKIKVILNLP